MQLEVNPLDKKYQKEKMWIADYIVPTKPKSNRRDLFLLALFAPSQFVKAGQIEIKYLLLIKIKHLSEKEANGRLKEALYFK